MTIIKYNNSKDMFVQIESGSIHHTRYVNFQKGQVGKRNISKKIKIRNSKTIKEYKIPSNKKYFREKETDAKQIWENIIDRCDNDEKRRDKNITYKDCYVCEDWYDFNNFYNWYIKNYYEIDNEVMCLDKDILHKDNKEYSPDKCILVSNRINMLFTKRQNDRGICPIGVYLDRKTNRYVAQCRIIENGKSIQKYLGMYKDCNEAFNSYKQFKEFYIKQVADEYKDEIPFRLYNAMYMYEVEITD